MLCLCVFFYDSQSHFTIKLTTGDKCVLQTLFMIPLGDLSLHKVKTIIQLSAQSLTSQSEGLTATELKATALTAPSWSLEGFNVLNDVKALT